MPVKVNSMDNGMTSAAMSAARKLPKNRNNTTITSAAPSKQIGGYSSNGFVDQAVRSYTGVATTPSGSVRLIADNFSAIARETERLFSPINISAVPRTTSSPSWVAAPLRNSFPIITSATSLMRIGTP